MCARARVRMVSWRGMGGELEICTCVRVVGGGEKGSVLVMCVCAHVCVCVCVRACVRARVRIEMYVCMCVGI